MKPNVKRCNRHGLVAVRDGACLLCIESTQRRRSLRSARLWLGGLACIAIGAIAFGHRQTDSSGDWSNQIRSDANRRPSKPGFESYVVTPLNRCTAPINKRAGSDDELVTDRRPSEEDRFLGTGQPPQLGPANPPPLPPRAPTDPQPPASDNPADFDLPDQSRTSTLGKLTKP